MSADTSTRLRAPGSSRGGRGAHSNHRGGTTRSSKSNTSAPTIASNTSPEYSRPDISEDEGGLGSLKKKHADNLAVLKELFSDWTDEDLIFALEDRNSDLELTIEGISEGVVSRWGKVKKKSERVKEKAKTTAEQPQSVQTHTSTISAPRGRGRADRGRGGRGGRVGFNGSRSEKPAAAQEDTNNGWSSNWGNDDVSTTKTDWDTAAPNAWSDAANVTDDWSNNDVPKNALPNDSSLENPEPLSTQDAWSSAHESSDWDKPKPATNAWSSEKSPDSIEPGKAQPIKNAWETKITETWERDRPKPTPPVVSQPTQQAPEPVQPAPAAVPVPDQVASKSVEEQSQQQQQPQSDIEQQQEEPKEPIPEQKTENKPVEQPAKPFPAVPPVALPIELTKTNLEKVPDTSQHHPSDTSASIKGTNGNEVSSGQPVVPPVSQGRPTGPKPSQRRVIEQPEAVVMPENETVGRAVDQTAVQFGSMNLNVHQREAEEPEAPELPSQPVQQPVIPQTYLPPSHQASIQAQAQAHHVQQHPPTRAPVPALVQPPAHQQAQPQAPTAPYPIHQQPQAPAYSAAESLSMHRAAPGLPPASQTFGNEASYNDYVRFSEAYLGQRALPNQDQFSNQTAIPTQPMSAATTGADYSPFFGMEHRSPAFYYPQYNQQDSLTPHRAAAGFGVTGVADMQQQQQQPTAAAQPANRYNHMDTSSPANAPHASIPTSQASIQSSQLPQSQLAHNNGAFYPNMPVYPYNHYPSGPFNRSRPAMYPENRRFDEHVPYGNQYAYANQYTPYAKNAAIYAQPAHGYPYEHATSPAMSASHAFGQTAVPGGNGRDAYGRGQPTHPPQAPPSGADPQSRPFAPY